MAALGKVVYIRRTMRRVRLRTDPLDGLDLADLIDRYRLNPRTIAQVTGRPPSTVRRWIRTNQTSPEALRLLRVHCAGKLPTACPTWAGWTVRGQWLIDPDGGCYESAEIRARWLVWQMLRSARQEPTPVQLRLF